MGYNELYILWGYKELYILWGIMNTMYIVWGIMSTLYLLETLSPCLITSSWYGVGWITRRQEYFCQQRGLTYHHCTAVRSVYYTPTIKMREVALCLFFLQSIFFLRCLWRHFEYHGDSKLFQEHSVGLCICVSLCHLFPGLWLGNLPRISSRSRRSLWRSTLIKQD